ncbi:MAG: response regulator transcription factor [Clostridiales bacterium]|nr:response regulator transcription factor [Clostridiales bacterium]
MKLLIVEDERRLADAMAQNLRRQNFDVDVAYDGEEGLLNALSGVYDVVLLDIMMPKKDGLSVLSELRAEGVQTPIILLTALGEVEDRVRGLDRGADDYLPKPFKTEELVARIKAVTRRRGTFRQDGILAFGDIELNPLSLVLACNGKTFTLTQKESHLLEYLIENKDLRLSSNSIIEKVWGYDSDAEDGNVQAYMSFLRKKLAALGSGVRIGNVRGSGYMLEHGEV